MDVDANDFVEEDDEEEGEIDDRGRRIVTHINLENPLLKHYKWERVYNKYPLLGIVYIQRFGSNISDLMNTLAKYVKHCDFQSFQPIFSQRTLLKNAFLIGYFL